QAEQLADAVNRRVLIALRVVGQQLVSDQGTVGTPRNDVGEGPAAVDPELPAAGQRIGHDLSGSGPDSNHAHAARSSQRIITGPRPWSGGGDVDGGLARRRAR